MISKPLYSVFLFGILITACCSIDQKLLENEKIDLEEFIKTVLKSNRQANVCCKIDPPSIPIFSSDGHLLHYQQSPCPVQYKTCCKGFISILGYCIALDTATEMLPTWQQLADSQGISLTEAIQLSGFLG